MKKFERSAHCGMIHDVLIGTEVTLCGWVNKRRDHGGLIFVDLRDRSGIVQIVFNPEISKQSHTIADQLRSEYVIWVSGVVAKRTQENINDRIATGTVEIVAKDLRILNSSETVPFNLENGAQVDEELRLRYRYLDIRRPEVQQKLLLRNKIIYTIREFFMKENFCEIETPILTKNTPEGSREFLVPSRLHHGSVYSLPQSPQLYKQLLMAGGMERYFQVARCFRDEDLRADRQPEFTQLDLEMSFITEENIIDVIERLLQHVCSTVKNMHISLPLQRMEFDVAFAKYGSDKPDTRFEMIIHDLAPVFHDTALKFISDVLGSGGQVGGFLFHSPDITRSGFDTWEDRAKKHGAKGLLWIRIAHDGSIESSVSKFLPVDFVVRLSEQFGKKLVPGDIIFILAGAYKKTWETLGRLRLDVADRLQMIPQHVFNFLWVTRFPLFEYNEDTKGWDSVNHPFTAPEEGWENCEISSIKSRSYDIVLNGVELGGGSIRITDPKIQQHMFKVLGLTDENIKQRFGFLIEAQRYGFPPHGGAALGLDRLVMLLSGAHSLREVIAFPKTQKGYDLMMEAPSLADKAILKEYGLELKKTE